MNLRSGEKVIQSTLLSLAATPTLVNCAVVVSQSNARMPSGVLEPMKTRWRAEALKPVEAAAARLAADAVRTKDRRVIVTMADAIVADEGGWMPLLECALRCGQGSSTLSLELGREQRMSHWISFVRIPALAIRQHIRPLRRIGVLEEDCVRLRVLPNDIDLNLHLNNARYLNWMDYGRIHLLARTRLLEHIIRSRWTPLVGAVWMTYRRSLPLFARFTLTSRLTCWDERWFYLEQTFASDKGLAAVGWVKGVLRGPEGSLDPQQVLERIEPGVVSPPIPDAIRNWNDLTREKLQGGV